ncbi:NAD-dependent epimerase/dehydratase family protein [Actinoplanes auranticolor]|uniref:NAD-dependent epimerase/dehydratase family protein n=1 Tax=Actinoplanes auranticolor TaxID=47988 RepID=UPI002484AB52|nr:GDP-mannose 4,6-dehydratase [Actinoplanes auranticolor]
MIGPGQAPSYLVPTLCRRILAAQREGRPVIRVGNADIVRDFVGIGDVVAGLTRIMDGGEPGRAYHLCTETGTSVAALVALLGRLTGVTLDARSDRSRHRPNDAGSLIGRNARAEAELGWRARTPLTETLAAVLVEARSGWSEPGEVQPV